MLKQAATLPMRARPFVRTRTRVVALASSMLAMASCVSPTLPLPPPDAPAEVSPSAEPGHWDVRGTCHAGAVVLVQNIATGVIVGVEDGNHDGRYFVQLEAEECDVGEVTELIETTVSEGTYFLISETSNGLVATDTCTAND
ncbi:MAG: hypothetical protein EXR75_14785 [Myxococcales bacterium]|nr:hypothetical protein [Myxococcales bacterium]